MQTERKYKIDKYIELARLTKFADKKEEFIDWAHHYLEMSEDEFDAREPKQSEVSYLIDKNKSDFIGKSSKGCYDEYVSYCRINEEKPLIHQLFSKELVRMFGIKTKHKNVNGVVSRYFVEGDV